VTVDPDSFVGRLAAAVRSDGKPWRRVTAPPWWSTVLLIAGARPAPDFPGQDSMTVEHAPEDPVADTAEAERKADAVRHVLREALEAQGYEVQDDFEAALGRDGVAHAHRAGWDDVAVRIRSGDDGSAFDLTLIAVRDAATADPSKVERQWTSAVDDLLPALSEHGLEPRISGGDVRGGHRVQYVDPARFPFERRRRDERRRAKDRRRDGEVPH
jgi:hypothetical protein